LLLAGFVLVNRAANVVITVPLVIFSIMALLGIFMSANRSGYLGVMVIALMLFWRKKGFGLIVVAGVTIVVGYILTTYLSTEIFENRIAETRQGVRSDDFRKALFLNCLDIGIKNPVLGVSPQGLNFELGRRTMSEYGYPQIESHNVFGFVWGGCGLVCFALFFGIAYTLWRYNPLKLPRAQLPADFRAARNLMRMLIFLFCARGMFTREILYNPGFVIALGLSIGLMIVTGENRQLVQEAHEGQTA
jgi:hypothetical protein